jgi:AraC family transcriptional regulator
MSASLSNSPVRIDIGGQVERPDGEPLYEVLARAQWPGLEFLFCREDIRRPTHWSIAQLRHTVIVHVGGAMRELETEIEGFGSRHASPSPGDIWLVPSEHRYFGQAHGHLITYVELRIAPDADVDLPGQMQACIDGLTPRMGHRDEFLYHAVVQLAHLAESGDDLSVMMAERLQRLLRQHLFRDYRTAGDARTIRLDRRLLSSRMAQRIDAHIGERLGERITLSELAAVADMTVHQLLIAFRRHFGTTPAQYILEQRLSRARWLLLNTGRDIADIAVSTGFASHSHFSAAFRRRSGTSQSALRTGMCTLAIGGASTFGPTR